jgi:hypothetical protein
MMISGLDSASVKIDRAADHLNEIRRIVASLAATANSYEIVKDSNGKEKIHFLIQPPSTISVLAGEAVYQLRSALDHLAFDLVKRNVTGAALPKGWENRCDFPLWLSIPSGQRPPLSYNCFKDLPGISETAFAFIESVQPYRSGVGAGTPNVMELLSKLSNIDRHRYLNVTLPKASEYHTLVLNGGREYSYGRGGLKDGAEVQALPAKAEDIVDVQRSFLTYVTFDEPTIGSGPDTLEVENILEVCLDHVKRIILPAFVHLLKSP